MDASIKAQILIWIVICGVLVMTTLLILYSLGNLSNLMERIEQIIEKEAVIRRDRIERQAAKELHSKKLEEDRKRRSEALLAMPLVSDKGDGGGRK